MPVHILLGAEVNNPATVILTDGELHTIKGFLGAICLDGSLFDNGSQDHDQNGATEHLEHKRKYAKPIFGQRGEYYGSI